MTTKRPEIEYIGANVRRLRLKLGWAQQRLAERAGLSFRAISKIENAEVDLSVGTLCALADALSVDVSKLFKPAKLIVIERGKRPAKKR